MSMNLYIQWLPALLCLGQSPAEIAVPKALVPGIAIDLVASEPEIVTPVGVTVDDQGRVIVVESHTHFRPEGYDGPPADRLRVFEDQDGDGRFETVETLHEGGAATMNVQVERDGAVLVANRAELFRLRRDDAGKVRKRELLARLITEGNYPHNGLSGLAVDLDGSIYVGMGENMGIAYTIEGADGTKLSGAGEGGNVFKLRSDGTGLRRFATGFWNPFEMELDDYGRLFLVDNDPDSRPPCRLIHVVDGGDYGYRFRNGRRGTHPFTSWDGELPGTLPMASGTGEAPSGLLQYDSDALPEAVRGKLLVTSWGEHRIYEYPLMPRGAGVYSKRGTLVEGGVQFRPVGIAQAPDGTLFVSDWVDRDYNLHRKGRVWRIRGKAVAAASRADLITSPDRRVRERAALALAASDAGKAKLSAAALDREQKAVTRALALRALAAAVAIGPDLQPALDDPSPEVRALAVRLGVPADLAKLRGLAGDGSFPEARAEALRRIQDRRAAPEIRAALKTDDPFLKQAAMVALGASFARAEMEGWARDADPAIRLAGLLVLRELDLPDNQDVLEHALVDADPAVRQAAVQWVAESGLKRFRARLVEGMRLEPTSPRLANSYVVALRRIDEGQETPDRELPYGPIAARLALDETLPHSLRTFALRGLRAETPELANGGLKTLLAAAAPGVRAEAVRIAAARGGSEDHELLRGIAADRQAPDVARAEALAGLDANDQRNRELLLNLAASGPVALRRQAARGLRSVALEEAAVNALKDAGVLDLLQTDAQAAALDDTALQGFLATSGDAAEGERIFFHPKGPGCYRCHQIESRGARIGPDLTTFGQNAGPLRVVESILKPSKEIAPQFAAWRFVNKDGTIAVGQMIEDRGNEQVYADSEGKTGIIKLNELEERAALPTSIMPENLWRQMTRQELRDLVEYLVQARTPDAVRVESSSDRP